MQCPGVNKRERCASKLQVLSYPSSSEGASIAQDHHISFLAGFETVDAALNGDIDLVALVIDPCNSQDMLSSCLWSRPAANQPDVEIKRARLFRAGQLVAHDFLKDGSG